MYWLYVDPYKELLLLISQTWNTPLPFFSVLIAVIVSVFWIERSLRRGGFFWKTIAGLAAAALTVYFFVTALWYLSIPGFLDHMEPCIPVLATLMGQGQPLYHALDAPERYSLLYGPFLFTLNFLFVSMFEGNVIFASKLSGVMFGLGSVGLIFFCCKKHFGFFCSTLQLCFVIVCCLWFGHYAYWNKAEPLLLFCGCCACCALLLRNQTLSVFIVAAAMAVSINLKIHSVLYFIPFLVAFLFYNGFRAFALCVVGSGLLCLLPFVNHTACPLDNYIQWLGIFSTHPLSLFVFNLNIKHFLLLFVPVMLLVWINLPQHSSGYRPTSTEQTIIILSGFFAMLLVCVLASKEGAGPHHLLPFAPFIVFIIGFLAPISKRIDTFSVRGLLTAMLIVFFSVAALLTAYKNQKLVWPFLMDNSAKEVVADIEYIKNKYRGLNMQMGYGGDNSYVLTWYRPLLLDVMQGYLA